MLGKEEAKEMRENFWKGFKRYCAKTKVDRRWVLTGVKIASTQLKFYADRTKALVLFQIDHKSDLKRYEIYECFMSYQTLMADSCGSDLKWDEEYVGMGERRVSAIYFELLGVDFYRQADHERIYAFFVEKMILLEEAYWEYRDLINGRLKSGI